jgi:hypothetical protein
MLLRVACLFDIAHFSVFQKNRPAARIESMVTTPVKKMKTVWTPT